MHVSIRNLHGMNKDENLSITSYAFVRVLQLYMYCLSYIGIVKGLRASIGCLGY